jgi:DNA-binding transcriptional LysR family regulator
MEFYQLEYFLQLTKYQNVTMTADFLHISQPALSKCIAQLEHELGVKLFDRIGRRIYLNNYGKNFAKYAEQCLMSLNAGILSTKEFNKEILGNISIALYCYGPIISNCISQYSINNPLVNVKFHYDLLSNSQHSQNDADFILISSTDDSFSNKDQFWITKPLFKERYLVVLSSLYKEYPIEQTKINLSELKDAPFIAMSKSENFFTDVTYKYCQYSGFIPKILYESNDFLIKLKLLQKGICVALLPESCIQDAKTFDPQLRFFDIENLVCDRTILIKRRKKNFMTNVAKSFWDFLLDFYNLPPDSKD